MQNNTSAVHKIIAGPILVAILAIALTGCGSAENSSGSDDTDNDNNVYWSPPLNDTGIDKFADVDSNDVPEPLDFPGQDAATGRDVGDNNDSDGRLGFHFVKLDVAGKPLADQNSDYVQNPWNCVHDEVTGLTWEVKTTSDWRVGTNTYTWYNADANTNGGDAGNEEGTHDASCLAFGEDDVTCNTDAYIKKVNGSVFNLPDDKTVTGLCGYTDWRLPSRSELRSLVDYGVINAGKKPKIDLRYFPNTQPAEYWSMHTVVASPDEAWEMHFGESEGSDIAGRTDAHLKSSIIIHVRLVRK